MLDYKLSLQLTDKCNLFCGHCYLARENKSISIDDMTRIIRNLDVVPSKVVLTGGEVYMERALLYSTIEAIKRRFGEKTRLKIETNATFFYHSDDDIIKEADRLSSLGVDEMRVSIDDFHVQGGADKESLLNVVHVLEGENHPLKIETLSLVNARALGNAESIDYDKREISTCMNSALTKNMPYLFVDMKGETCLCPWKASPSVGNIKENPASKILENLKDTLQSLILQGDLTSVARIYSLEDSLVDKLRSERGDCGICNYLFKKG